MGAVQVGCEYCMVNAGLTCDCSLMQFTRTLRLEYMSPSSQGIVYPGKVKQLDVPDKLTSGRLLTRG